MAFCSRSFSSTGSLVVGLAAGTPSPRQITFWRYATDDAAATVEAAGYFNGVRAQLTVGDAIDAVMACGGTPVIKGYVVTAVPSSGNVTIALQATTAG